MADWRTPSSHLYRTSDKSDCRLYFFYQHFFNKTISITFLLVFRHGISPFFKLYPQNNFFKFLTENRARASVRSEENARKFSQHRGKRLVQICTTQNWIHSNSQLTKHIQVASSAWTHRPYIVECYLIFINLYKYTHTRES